MSYRNGKLKSLELYEEQCNGKMHHFLKGVLGIRNSYWEI